MARVTRLRPNMPVHALAYASPIIAPIVTVAGLVTHAWPAAIAGAALVFLGRLPWLYVTERHVLAKREPADVEADETGIVVDGKERIPASEIRDAVLWPNAGRKPTLRVKTDKALPVLECEVESWDEGHSMLRALRFDAAHAPAKFTTLVPQIMKWGFISLVAVPMGTLLALQHFHHHASSGEVFAYMMASLAVAIVPLRMRRTIIVRPDALVVSLLGRSRTIPWSDVKSTERSLNSATLTLASGEKFPLRVGNTETKVPEGQRTDDALTERVIEAHAAATVAPVPSGPPAPAREGTLPASVMLLHPRNAVWVASIASYGAMFALLLRGKQLHSQPWIITAAVAAAIAFGLHMFAMFRPNRITEEPVTKEAGGLRIGTRTIARSAIENAYVQPAGGVSKAQTQKIYYERPRVVFTGKKRRDSLSVLVSDEAEGNALLGALDLDPAHAVATFNARSGIVDSSVAQIALFVMLTGGWRFIGRTHGPLRWVLIAAMVVAAVNGFWPTKVRVGADGVLVKSLRKKRFVAYADVSSVEATEKGAVLVMRSGERVAINTSPIGTSANFTRDALIKRLSDGLAAAKRTSDGLARVLARGDRTTHDWLIALRALGAGQSASYREASVEPSELWAVIEDAGAGPQARASAAAAVRVADPTAAERLRVVASSTASPKLRVALEAAADSDDARLEQALAECAEEELGSA